jgi:ubiquinone/menaquinone biosynthesis C-methylase UbiE
MTQEFYERAIKQEGVDYNFYGDWQKSYAKMVISVTNILKAATDNRESILLDIGCACGVTLRAFKETKVFGHCIGIDSSKYMVELGRSTHNFSPEEMMVMNITKESLPCKDNSVTLIHCTHVLEHIHEKDLTRILKEMYRVLEPITGLAFIIIPTVKLNNPVSEIEREESHVTIKDTFWWEDLFTRKLTKTKKFHLDPIINRNFKETIFSPVSSSDKSFYDYYNDGWTLFGLRKDR